MHQLHIARASEACARGNIYSGCGQQLTKDMR